MLVDLGIFPEEERIMKDKGAITGRPRRGPHIENERFWGLPKSSLEYVIKDASEAMKANPTGRKASSGPGNYADVVLDAYTVLGWRERNPKRGERDD
jgi:hypothetical protein